MKISLELISDSYRDLYELQSGEKVKIGRSSNCDWVLKDNKISSIHCCFFFREDRLEIVDLNSKNGTFLNGIRIETADFFIGDHIKIGESTIWLRKQNADSDAIAVLTFPGPNKNGLKGRIVEDFTSARIENQIFNIREHEKLAKSRLKGTSPKISRSVKKSKEELRRKYRVRAIVANFIDIELFACTSLLLFYIFRLIQPNLSNHFSKIAIFIIMQIFGLATLFFLNHRYQKFTIGEKISGIAKIFSER